MGTQARYYPARKRIGGSVPWSVRQALDEGFGSRNVLPRAQVEVVAMRAYWAGKRAAERDAKKKRRIQPVSKEVLEKIGERSRAIHADAELSESQRLRLLSALELMASPNGTDRRDGLRIYRSEMAQHELSRDGRKLEEKEREELLAAIRGGG